VEPVDFDEAIDRVVAGLAKKNRVMNPQEKEIVAFHESGHAIVAESVEHADPVHKISIIPRGIAALGYTQQQPTEDRYLMTRSELLDRLAVLLGGRVAEELAFGEISTGAQNDLQRATDIARSMVTEYGMSDRLGLVTYERPRQAMFLPESFSPNKTYSEEKAGQIDEEIFRVVDEAHQRVRGILSAHRMSWMIWLTWFRRRKLSKGRNSERCWAKPQRNKTARGRTVRRECYRTAPALWFPWKPLKSCGNDD
jgi:cell division protease FtsH